MERNRKMLYILPFLTLVFVYQTQAKIAANFPEREQIFKHENECPSNAEETLSVCFADHTKEKSKETCDAEKGQFLDASLTKALQTRARGHTLESARVSLKALKDESWLWIGGKRYFLGESQRRELQKNVQGVDDKIERALQTVMDEDNGLFICRKALLFACAPWTAWSPCSISKTSRTRTQSCTTVDGGTAWTNAQSEDCPHTRSKRQTKPCPGHWSEWSSCTDGMKTRKMKCKDGNEDIERTENLNCDAGGSKGAGDSKDSDDSSSLLPSMLLLVVSLLISLMAL